MMYGEFESMTALYSVMPSFCPMPIAWGTFKSDPNQHFFLCDFHEKDQDLPEMNKFSLMLAELHQKSELVSPNEKFGFHVTTYNGNLPQDNRWNDTWGGFLHKA